jgi:hypothetical protein
MISILPASVQGQTWALWRSCHLLGAKVDRLASNFLVTAMLRTTDILLGKA